MEGNNKQPLTPYPAEEFLEENTFKTTLAESLFSLKIVKLGFEERDVGHQTLVIKILWGFFVFF